MSTSESATFDALKLCVNHFLEYRVHQAYYFHRHFGEDARAIDPVNNRDLPGNLGACVQLLDDKVVGNSLIAPSGKLQSAIRDMQRDAFYAGTPIRSSVAGVLEDDGNMHLGKYAIWLSGYDPNGVVQFFGATLSANPVSRRRDSEWILLNICDDLLSHDPTQFNTIVLVTERIPCASCTGVIVNFLQRHAEVRLVIAFLYDTANAGSSNARGEPQFRLETIAVAARITVWKCLVNGDERKLDLFPAPST
jgi:hypothetical protein